MAVQMEKRKRNGLEVTCIGFLYQGPWEKKYWSSSRGKDRYPYPVGYQAVRCYNGNSYHMEIQEGARGPLFLVAFGEGIKCSADTPTIAWQDAMKKTSSLSKRMRGRSLSSDINGSELFGFLDPLVQRLFRELILVQEGEAQQVDIACSQNKADDVANQKSIMAGCSEGFGWGSTRTVQVRKSRTSIVRSETKGSCLSNESSQKQLGCVKGYRKRLKLVKPPKRTKEISEAELSGPCEHSLPQILSPKASQPREGCIEVGIKISQMQEDLCRSMKDAFQEISKEELLKGTVIPDSYDDFPSQMYAGQERMQVKLFPSMNTCSENKNQHLALTTGDIAYLPVVSLSEPQECEDSLSLKHKLQINLSQKSILKFESKNQDLSSPAETALEAQLNNAVIPDSCYIESPDLSLPTKVPLEVQLKNAVVPDSCDIESQDLSLLTKIPPGVQLKNAVVPDSSDIESQDLSLPSKVLPEVQRKNTVVPDSFDTETLNKASSVIAVVNSQVVLEQASALSDKSSNMPGHSAKEGSQSSEGNTQKGESDSLGQELTKSMITLLLPQALQIYSNKGRKRRRPITSTVNKVEQINLPKVASELGATDEKEPILDSNELKQRVLEELNSRNEDKGASCDEGDGICAGSDENQLHSVTEGQSNKPFSADNEFHNICHESCVESSHKIKQLSGVGTQTCQHQVPTDSTAQIMSCTVIPCENSLPTDSSLVKFLSKEQLYNANDRKNVSSLSTALKSLLPEGEERSLTDQNCLQSPKNEGNCLPLSNSLTIMETKDPFTEGMQTEVKKGTSPLKVINSSTRVVPDHILGSDAMESALKPISGQEMSAVILPSIHDEVQPKHSVNSSAVMGPLACQEASNINDLCVEQRSAEASELKAKDCISQSENFVPKVCLEHPMPILAMKITVQDDQARLLICCGYRDATRLLLVYQMAGKELLPSIFSSTTFDILDYDSNTVSRGLVESNGIHFTPGGQELLLLGMFKIRETTEEKQASPPDQNENCLCDIQLVLYNFGKFHIASRLSSAGSQLYCVLPADPCTVIAGGESGLVVCWIMDTSWRMKVLTRTEPHKILIA